MRGARPKPKPKTKAKPKAKPKAKAKAKPKAKTKVRCHPVVAGRSRKKVCVAVKKAKHPAKRQGTVTRPVFVPTPPPAELPVVPPVTSVPPSAVLPVTPDPPAPAQPPSDPPAAGLPALSGPLSAAQAERLLWRAGFGPRPGQVRALTGADAVAAVRALTRPGTYTLTGPAPHTEGGWPLFPDDMWGHDHAEWLDRMVRCDQPLIERMALIWHDWFATNNGAVACTRWARAQIQMFRQKGLDSSFDDLFAAVTSDPAMLIFLNGISNSRWNPNENYAREMMELFSLGADRGAYTEADIREAAKALTGWTATWQQGLGWTDARYDAARHRTGTKTIFGQSGDFGWRDVVGLCVEHPLHASFFVTKLWSYFVPTRPDTDTLAHLTGIYLAAGRRIRPVVEAILLHPACLDGPAMAIPPVVYTAGLMRSVGRYIDDEYWSQSGDAAGQRLYYPPNVAGWDDARWLNTATLRGRWQIARRVLNRSYIDPWPGRPPDYDPAETPQQALGRALAALGDPSIASGTRTRLVAFAGAVEGLAGGGDRRYWLAQRQNALRMLIATAPERQVC